MVSSIQSKMQRRLARKFKKKKKEFRLPDISRATTSKVNRTDANDRRLRDYGSTEAKKLPRPHVHRKREVSRERVGEVRRGMHKYRHQRPFKWRWPAVRFSPVRTVENWPAQRSEHSGREAGEITTKEAFGGILTWLSKNGCTRDCAAPAARHASRSYEPTGSKE